MKALLSIKPEFVEAIRRGEKLFEYRKSIFKKKVTKVIIYETMPVGKVIGEFDIEKIIKGTPEEIWKATYLNSGVEREFYNNYFSHKEKAFAIQIKDFIEYDTPLSLKEYNTKIKVAPQSFLYL